MTTRLIDVDDELLAAAQRELQTTGVAETVRVALQHATASSARVRQTAWLRAGGLEEPIEPDALGGAWR